MSIPYLSPEHYRPGTVILMTRGDFHFIAAAISDDGDDIFLSKRKYTDQGKALDFAERWFDDQEDDK